MGAVANANGYSISLVVDCHMDRISWFAVAVKKVVIYDRVTIAGLAGVVAKGLRAIISIQRIARIIIAGGMVTDSDLYYFIALGESTIALPVVVRPMVSVGVSITI